MTIPSGQPCVVAKGVGKGVTMGALFIAAILLLIGIAVPDWFIAIIMLVVRDYFAERGKPENGG